MTTQANFKRSIDGIFTAFTNLKKQKAGEVEKPLKSALFNVGLLIILAATLGVFLVLGPFLKPLLWSVVFGAVLFPSKKKLSREINSWIDAIETHEAPIVLGILLLPFKILVQLGEIISRWLVTNIKILLIALGSIIFLQLVLSYVPSELYSSLVNVLMWNHSMFGKVVGLLNVRLIIMMMTSYITAVFVLWSSPYSSTFTILGQSLWIFIVAYFSSFLGSLQIPTFLCCIIYGLAGVFYYENNQDGQTLLGKRQSFVTKHTPNETEKPLNAGDHASSEVPLGLMLKTKAQLSEIKQKMQLSLHAEDKNLKLDEVDGTELESDTYFKALFYACAATILWKQMWILFLCLIPMSCYAIKELFKILGFLNYVEHQWTNKYSKILGSWFEPRRDALVPIFLPGIIQLNLKIHKFVCKKMKSIVDDISSIAMIIAFVFTVIFFSVFFSLQIYSENLAVAQLGSNLINRTLTLRPELVEMLPINMQSMNDIIDNVYKYSRGTIEDYIDNAFNQTNPEQANKLKIQILAVWDRLIQSYMDRNKEGIGPRVPSESVMSTIDEIVTTSGVTFTGLFGWAQNNIGMLMEIGDSIWIVLKANFSILFSTLTTLFSVVLGGGHAMLKFVFNTIIFFTTLYYLLQSSQDRYAPIAMNINSAWGTRLTDALEDSVSSVLVATMKLSLFHGLFTWLTHTVFGAHVVYLPSILASILAAAPFLETYWCTFPAFLDLWLSQDRFYLGLTLVLIHFIVPSNFNPIVHSEIKGAGHPYLTALSIVGGMYLFGGVEGCILGPILLCLLVVLCSVTVNSLNSPINTLTQQSSVDDSISMTSPAP